MAKRRPAGDGLVRKRSDGRWEGRIVVGHKEDGAPIFRSVFAHTQKEVMRKLNNQIETYRDVELTEESNLTLGEWMDKWLDNYMALTIRESTMDSYKTMTKHYIKPYLGGEKIGSITTADIQQLYNWLRENGRVNEHYEKGNALSDSMIRSIHMMLHQAMDAAVREHLIVKNPTEGTVIPKNNYPPKQILTQEEMQRFLIQAKQDGYYELFLLELGTGLRLGEILALQWTDLNFTTGELRITKSATFIEKELVLTEPKTKSSIRSIILPPSLLKVLGEYKKTVKSRWMFPSPVKEDAPITPSYARRRMQQTLERAQCKKVRFHDLRHTFATMALEHGMDVKTLSTIIGHVSSATTLDIYSHVTDTMQKQAAVKIDRQIGKTDAPMPQEEKKQHTDQSGFPPYQPKHRKPGTGCVYQINDHLWEGKYSPVGPDGKRIRRNVYAPTKEECEEKLAVMIEEVKREISSKKGYLLHSNTNWR